MNSENLIINVDVANGFIKGFNLIPPLYRYVSIEDSAAEILANSEVQLDLDGVRIISIAAIRNLVKRQDSLCLGIPEINNDQAEALTKLRKCLSLNNLSEISLSALETICSTPRELLSLDGLLNLTPVQACALAHFQGGLSLRGLTRLDEGVAPHLALHVGSLVLENLEALTTEDARYLASHQGSIILNTALKVPREGAYLLRKYLGLQVNSYSLEDLIEDCLSDGTEQAISIAKHIFPTNSETLRLDSLKVLQPSGAKILAQFQGNLQLIGLEEIGHEAAVLLAKHNGSSLELDGLKTITSHVAEAFGKYCGELSLGGLVSLDEESARLLALHEGCLLLDGIRSLTVAVAKGLGMHHGELSFRKLESFDEGSPALLALHDGPLRLPLPEGGNNKYGWFRIEHQEVFWNPSGIDSHDLAVMKEILDSQALVINIQKEVCFISNTILARLGYACRRLGMSIFIPGLNNIDQEQCKLLIGSHIKKPHTSGNPKLVLNGLLDLSEQVAQLLGTSGLALSLAGLTKISSKALQNLTQDIYDLSLCGIRSIDSEGCKHLANVPGHLILSGIKTLPAGGASALSLHRGRLTLNGIFSLSEEDINNLSQHVGNVDFLGIQWDKMNSNLLNNYIGGKFILNSTQIFELVRKYGIKYSNLLRFNRSHNSKDVLLNSVDEDLVNHDLIVRFLIQILTFCVDLGESNKFEELDVMYNLDISIGNSHVMAIDGLVEYVRENYLIQEKYKIPGKKIQISSESNGTCTRSSNGEVLFRKIYGIANEGYWRYRCPGRIPIIDACCKAANAIMCFGLQGKSSISYETLFVLGSLFGEVLDFPLVDKLCVKGALALSLMESDLLLNNLKEINTEVAKLLSSQKGRNFCIEEIYSESVYNGVIELNGLRFIDVDTAKELAAHRCNVLRLNGIATISDAVAEALSSHKDHHKDVFYQESRKIELNGLLTLSPRSALYLTNLLDKDPWDLVDESQVKTRFVEAISVFQTGGDEQGDCVLNAFINLTILLSHLGKFSELDYPYVSLRNSLETKFGKASKAWVTCVIHAARARGNNELSTTDLILQETTPVVSALIYATAAEEQRDLRFIEWVAEAGETEVADALLEKLHEHRQGAEFPTNDLT